MNDSDPAHQDLFDASKALLEKSGLVSWDGQAFVPTAQGSNDCDFERYWSRQFHERFGRYMAWVLFSVGAENLAKAACACRALVKKPHYGGALENYTKPNGWLHKLCSKATMSASEKDTLTCGYKRLQRIRNRDAHAYIAGVRQANFSSVEQVFVPAFNILVKTIRKHRTGDQEQ